MPIGSPVALDRGATAHVPGLCGSSAMLQGPREMLLRRLSVVAMLASSLVAQSSDSGTRGPHHSLGSPSGVAAESTILAGPAKSTVCQPQWLPTFGTTFGVNSYVLDMVIFDDGSGPALYSGGSFDAAGGVPASRI